MTEELERFAAVVRQYVDSQGESKAAKQAMINGLEYVEKLISDNSEYVPVRKSCRNCAFKGLYSYKCVQCIKHDNWKPA